MTHGMATPSHVRTHAIEPMLVFFDGDCAMCRRSIRFLLRRSRVESFRFVPLQSLANSQWENEIRTQLGHDLQTSIVLWKNGQFLNRSRAVLAISAALGFPWNMAVALRIFPSALLDFGYALVARTRRPAGKSFEQFCQVISPKQRHLLLSEPPDIRSKSHPIQSAHSS
ncbi:MAG: DCC1-like thiol-disulfide oxidoreductase family protein [Planctomycetota bacterium]|nr:DCC1-like thiol-disulfide oxidoreductase family protein [Planctomycetota bacterium]